MRTFFVLYFSALCLVPVALYSTSRTVPFAIAGIKAPNAPRVSAQTVVTLPEVVIVGTKPQSKHQSKPQKKAVGECWPSQFKGSAAHPVCF